MIKSIFKSVVVNLLTMHLAFAGVSEGAKLPDFDLKHLNRNGNMSSSSLNGKVTLVDFWASWCVPCRSAMPAYQSLYNKFHGKGFNIVAIDVDKDAAAGLNFVKKLNISYTLLHDPDGKLASQFELPTMPTSYLVDKNGNVAKVYPGFRKSDIPKIEADIEGLLK